MLGEVRFQNTASAAPFEGDVSESNFAVEAKECWVSCSRKTGMAAADCLHILIRDQTVGGSYVDGSERISIFIDGLIETGSCLGAKICRFDSGFAYGARYVDLLYSSRCTSPGFWIVLGAQQ